MARIWTSKSGVQMEAAFQSVQGSKVVLKGTNDAVYRIALDELSDQDREFVASLQKTTNAAAEPAPPPVADPKAFVDVMNRTCARCHKFCSSVDQMVAKGWIVPGKPDSSRVYTIIGKHRKPGATYHNLSDQDKKTVRDFVTAYRTNAVPAHVQ